MTLSFTSLGYSPLLGNAAVEHAISFKRQLRAVLPFAEGVSPMIVPDAESRKCEVRVAYDKSIPGAESWAKRAREISGEVWGMVEKRKGMEVG